MPVKKVQKTPCNCTGCVQLRELAAELEMSVRKVQQVFKQCGFKSATPSTHVPPVLSEMIKDKIAAQTS